MNKDNVMETNNYSPQIPVKVRTVTYFILLGASALVLGTQGLAPIWAADALADQLVQSAGVVAGILGLVGGGLGVAYRPTRNGATLGTQTPTIGR